MAGDIAQYMNRAEAPRATSAGSEAFEIEGRHVEASYGEAGQAIGQGLARAGQAVGEYEEMQDTSAISAQGAKAFADLSDSLRTTMANADPNQADVTASKWRDEALQQGLNDIGADANTRKGKEMAERVQNTLREEFTRQSIGAASTLGSVAITENLTQVKNGLAQAVSNNPSLLPTALAYLHGTMQDQLSAHTALSPQDAARVHSEVVTGGTKDLALAAAETMGQRSPQGLRDALHSGFFAGAFSAEEIGHLENYANMQDKAQIEASKAQETMIDKANKKAYDGAVNGIYTQMLQPDGSLHVPPDLPQQIVKAALMPGAEPGTSRSMIEMVKAINTENAKGVKITTDPQTDQVFGQKLMDGTLTDRDLYSARASGLLSDKDLQRYRTGIRDLAADPAKKEAEKQFQQFLNNWKPSFTTSGLFGKDPRGDQNFFTFTQAMRPQFEAAYKNGTWQQLLTRGNSQFLGNQAPSFMHQKGSTPDLIPRFTNAADADKFYNDPTKHGQFYGPDGVLRSK